MNDGQYTNIRNYLEELVSQGKQLLAAQQRTNELLEQLTVSRAKGATSEFVEGSEKPKSATTKKAKSKTDPKPNVNWNS